MGVSNDERLKQYRISEPRAKSIKQMIRFYRIFPCKCRWVQQKEIEHKRENVDKANFLVDSIMKMYYALSEGDDMHDEQKDQ